MAKNKAKIKAAYRKWSKEDIKFLKKYYLRLSIYEVAEKLDRPPEKIRARAWALGLYKKAKQPLWSKEDVKLLKKYYPLLFKWPSTIKPYCHRSSSV